jgi:DNA-binding response OmpR family regulator
VTSVLMVDDDENGGLTTMVLLEDEGFTVELVGSLSQARPRIMAARYDLILLDQRLGDGDGRDLVPIIRAHQPWAKAVLLTGADAAPNDPPLDDVISKGLAFHEFAARLRTVLASPSVP